jgi:antitoxin component YwqK of YwqJK toxin-antitoxin module
VKKILLLFIFTCTIILGKTHNINENNKISLDIYTSDKKEKTLKLNKMLKIMIINHMEKTETFQPLINAVEYQINEDPHFIETAYEFSSKEIGKHTNTCAYMTYIHVGNLEENDYAVIPVYITGTGKQTPSSLEKKQDGVEKLYHKNGKLWKELPYKNNQIDGIAREYDEDGKTQAQFTYKNEKLDGSFKRYYGNGNKKNQGTYKDGRMYGAIKQYNEEGKLIAE